MGRSPHCQIKRAMRAELLQQYFASGPPAASATVRMSARAASRGTTRRCMGETDSPPSQATSTLAVEKASWNKLTHAVDLIFNEGE